MVGASLIKRSFSARPVRPQDPTRHDRPHVVHAGVLVGVKRIAEFPGVTIGLDTYLGL